MTQHQGQTPSFPTHELNGFAVRLPSLISLIVWAIITGCARRHYFVGVVGGGPPNDIFCLHLFTCVSCLFVVGGVRVLLWIWLQELGRFCDFGTSWTLIKSNKLQIHFNQRRVSLPTRRLCSARWAGGKKTRQWSVWPDKLYQKCCLKLLKLNFKSTHLESSRWAAVDMSALP